MLLVLGDLGNLYQTIVEGARDAATDEEKKEANLHAVGAFKKALSGAVTLLPGGGLAKAAVGGAIEVQGGISIDDLFEADEKKRIENLDPEGLAAELESYLRPLAALALFSNPELMRHYLPPGSPQAERFAAWVQYDDQGNPTVTIPPPPPGEEAEVDPRSWNSFVNALIAESRIEGSPLGDDLERIDDRIETFKPQ